MHFLVKIDNSVFGSLGRRVKRLSGFTSAKIYKK